MVVALATLTVIVVLALSRIGASGADRAGAAETVSVITASGAILTGLVGAYFGVNVAHRAQTSVEGAQRVAQDASRQAEHTIDAMQRSSDAAITAAAALDPRDPAHQDVLTRLMRR
ncbi:MAG TPA: hypothetical protein VI357_16205 [Mycobacteriales bacterium]